MVIKGVDINESPFIKDDKGKRRWTLLDYNALAEVVDVMEIGAGKYGEGNWARHTDPKRCLDALFRHLVAYKEGEKDDKESGLSHMAHIICNAMFILHYEQTKREVEE